MCSRGSELFAGRDPAAGLDAENAQVNGVTFRGDDSVFADHTILLASGDDLAGQEEEWALGIVDEDEAVHFSAVVMNCGRGVTANQSLYAAGFGDDDFAGAKAFVECKKFAGGIALCGDDGKDREVTVTNWIENFEAGSDFSRSGVAVIDDDETAHNQQEHESQNDLRTHSAPPIGEGDGAPIVPRKCLARLVPFPTLGNERVGCVGLRGIFMVRFATGRTGVRSYMRLSAFILRRRI